METKGSSPYPYTVTVRRNPHRKARPTPSSAAPASSSPPRNISSFPIEDILSMEVPEKQLTEPSSESLKVFMRIRALISQKKEKTVAEMKKTKNTWPKNPKSTNALLKKLKKSNEVCVTVNDAHSVTVSPPQSLQDGKRIKSEVYQGFSQVFSSEASQQHPPIPGRHRLWLRLGRYLIAILVLYALHLIQVARLPLSRLGEPIQLSISTFALEIYEYGILNFVLTSVWTKYWNWLINACPQFFVCPVWAGEDLHKLVSCNLEKLATFLQGFGSEYFSFSEIDESGKQYLKIGVLARECACHLQALSGYFNSKPQVPTEFHKRIEEACTKMSIESSKVLKELSSSIRTMTQPSSSAAETHLRHSKTAVDDFKDILATTETLLLSNKLDLLEIFSAVTVASVFSDVINCVDKISEAVEDLLVQAHFKKDKKNKESSPSPEKPPQHLLFHRGIVKPVVDVDDIEGGDSIVTEIYGGGAAAIVAEVKPPAVKKREEQIVHIC
ncbi:hypothetical protein K7X08_029558 [Anisodus acutangulus]|uniref:Uncharacterized protein n=1 Tax=Anisodus acutangulus TaxID=402998 RepID=A0A9Q1L4T8_9SOLA|nr:hypothetical protein K7X08_029558 [Anisodus acutangulus]